MITKPITIPFIELIKRSLGNVLLNLEYFFKLSILPVIILTVGVILDMEPISFMILSMLMASFVSVHWCRKVILNENISWNNLQLKFIGNYIVKHILFSLILVAPAIVISAVLSSMSYYIGIPTYQETIILASAIVTLITVFFAIRLRIVLAATAVDDKELGFELAFKISQDNTTRLFFAGIVIALPCIILMQILVIISFLFYGNIIGTIIWNLMFYTLSMLLATFYASYDAHVYQYFTYFHRKNIEDSEAQAADILAEEKIKNRRK